MPQEGWPIAELHPLRGGALPSRAEESPSGREFPRPMAIPGSIDLDPCAQLKSAAHTHPHLAGALALRALALHERPGAIMVLSR